MRNTFVTNCADVINRDAEKVPTQLFVQKCNATDPLQKWTGTGLTGRASALVNVGTHKCMHQVPGNHGSMVATCDRDNLVLGYVRFPPASNQDYA